MTRRDLPKYVYPYGRKGYLYYRPSKKAKPIRIHSELGTPEFYAEYALLRKARPTAPSQYSFNALIDSYRQSARYTDRAERTRKDYDKVLAYLGDKWGKFDPRKLQRKDVIYARDANADAVRFANYVVQVLSILMEHSIDIGWRRDNPAIGTKLLKSTAPQRQPWPDDLIEAFRQEAPIGTRSRLIFELCVGTGQRVGDVLRLRWSDCGPEGIKLRQSKTGAGLVIPYTRQLHGVLAVTERKGLVIVAGENGKPVSYRSASEAIMKVRKAIGAEAYDIHALRHTAASQLAEAGCTDEEIMAITGHTSRASVARYAAAARQQKRARDAQNRRDGG